MENKQLEDRQNKLEKNLDDLIEIVAFIKDNMITKDDIANMATKDDIANMATKDDIANMATKDDIANMATKDDIANMATKDDIANMATKDDLKELRMELKKDIADLRTELKEDIENAKIESTAQFRMIQEELDDIKNHLDRLQRYTIEDSTAAGHDILELRQRVDFLEKQVRQLQSA